MAGVPIDWHKVAKKEMHPLRYQLLCRYTDGEAHSPKQLCDEFDELIGNVSYHITTLVEAGLIRLKSTRQVRGAVEHFYVLVR